MTTLNIRPLQHDADYQFVVELINACEAVDQLDEGTSLAELRQELAHPDINLARDIMLWEDADGLAAYADVRIRQGDNPHLFTWFRVRPDLRGNGLEEQVLAWAAERARETGHEYGYGFHLASNVNQVDTARIALLEGQGFRPVRYFWHMQRSLDDALPEPALPSGYRLRQLSGAAEYAAWVELFNQSFIDHWNFQPLTIEQMHHYNNDPNYRADLDLIAIAPDTTFAAFCYSIYNQEANARSGRNEGYIAVLGTRRGYRKLGLGRAMLQAGMQCLKQAGAESVALHVDAENPSGAGSLYASQGFQTVQTNIAYMRDIEQ